jgi:ADP-ribose pyrophosphatase YjhB (NUDIX family)
MEKDRLVNKCLREVPRLQVDRKRKLSQGPYRLWLPDGVTATFDVSKQIVTTRGLGELDKKHKDLIEIIVVEDAIAGSYAHTGVLVPRTFAESLQNIPLHLTTQAIIFTKPDEHTSSDLFKMSRDYSYGCTGSDRLWLGEHIPQKFDKNDTLMVLNRRIGGWDGSPENPVIELLGAGGHVPVVWDARISNFRSLTPEEALIKEIHEEIGLAEQDYDLVFVGGFINSVTSELVILFSVMIPWRSVVEIQAAAYGNYSENIDGLYVGKFKDVINMYEESASLFAGGLRAKETNFPSNIKIMSCIDHILSTS